MTDTVSKTPEPGAVTTADKTAAGGPSVLKIEPTKIVDLIVGKQTQYYTLWGVYTAVQFAAGSYGYGHSLSLGLGLAVFFGVWAFNVGHLGFVLRCVAQLNKFKLALDAALREDEPGYQAAVLNAFMDMPEGALFWRKSEIGGRPEVYYMNCSVHFFIDICASIALLVRVDYGWMSCHILRFLTTAPLDCIY